MDESLEETAASEKFTVKKCLVINTGGTLGMEATNQGLGLTKSLLRDKMKRIKAFYDSDHSATLEADWISTPIADSIRVYYKVLQYESLIDSTDMTYDRYVEMARTIEANYLAYDAFVIVHGTDTLEYTAAALSFMFENLGKTVIVTGSQIPLSDQKNDAVMNLLGCFHVIAKFIVPEVCVYFRDCLYRGNRVKKVDSGNLNAIESLSYPPLATDNVDLKVNWSLVLQRPWKFQKLTVHYVRAAHAGAQQPARTGRCRRLVLLQKNRAACALYASPSSHLQNRPPGKPARRVQELAGAGQKRE